jgi:Tfp pilus assembly protein PilN
MGQNINLYRSVLIDRPNPLQTRQSGLLLLAFLALLIGLTLFSYWQLQNRQQLLEDLQHRTTERETLVSQLEQQFPPREKNPQLEGEVRHLELRLAGQKQLLGYFTSRENGGNGAILGTLEGLAKHVQKGVWLTNIQLEDSGQQVGLGGSALRPELVPAYLQSLGQQGVFRGQVFSRFKLTSLQEQPTAVTFSLESKPEARP